jgi:putative membrane protein
VEAPAVAEAENKTELAEDRTNLAEDRTVLANERTFAGWMRTGFAAVGVGLGFQALFNKMEPDWVPKGIATAFLLIAILVFWSAERRARSILSRLESHAVETVRSRHLSILSWFIMAAISALIAAMWLLKIKSGS